ncbi:MAG: TPM domain-containing protein, partial [Bacteroidota bacterium]
TVAFAQKAVPELWNMRVHDDAHVLSQETIDQLENQLRIFEDSTSNQIAILIISSLDDEVLEEYSLKVAETWKLGTARNDNGVLLLVAVDDHKMRIEVGLGLEGVLTDAQCNRIIRNEMAPAFRRDDYDAGVGAGIDAIIKSIGGEYQATDDVTSDGLNMGLGAMIGVSLFVFGILGLFTAIALFSKGGPTWFLYVFLIPFYAAFPMGIYGTTIGLYILGTYVIGFPIAKYFLNRSPKWKGKMLEWQSSSGGGRSGGGSSWSSGGGSSGGFSGGGGSFGGGGSSGGW